MKFNLVKAFFFACIASGFFVCNFAGAFLSKDVQSVYVEDSVAEVGSPIELNWVNSPAWMLKDAEWGIVDGEGEISVSEDYKTAVVSSSKEGNLSVALSYGGDTVDIVNLSFVDDSISEDFELSVNGTSEVWVSDFIQITDPTKLEWVSSNEEILPSGLFNGQRGGVVKPLGVGDVTLSAYYGEEKIGDVNIHVDKKEKLPEECYQSFEDVVSLNTSYIYNNLSDKAVYSLKVDASTYLGLSSDAVFCKLKKGSSFSKGDKTFNTLSDSVFALKEGKELIKVKIKDREYRLKVTVHGNDKSVIYKNWLKTWLKGIDKGASEMDKARAAFNVINSLKFDATMYDIESIVENGSANSYGGNSLFVELCKKMGIEDVSKLQVNQDIFKTTFYGLSTASDVNNYTVSLVTLDGEKYIIEACPGQEGVERGCYKVSDAEHNVWVNLWGNSGESAEPTK